MATTVQTANLLQTPFFSHEPIPTELKELFVARLWPLSMAALPESILDFETYFDFVQQERDPSLAPHHHIRNFNDIVSLIEIIANSPSATFAQLRDILQSITGSTTSEMLSKISLSLELAVRLWLMCNVRNVMPSDQHQLEESIPWPDTLSLKSALGRKYTRQPGDPRARFPEYLNVHDMNKIAGFRVKWTNSLTSHLSIKGRIISVFHNVSTLQRMRASFSK